MGFCVVLTTVSGPRKAEGLARGLVKEKLAACVTVLPQAVSHYRWKGALERSRESLMLIKTDRRSWVRVERFLRKNHPYTLPEMIVLPVSKGSKDYLSWMCACLKK